MRMGNSIFSFPGSILPEEGHEQQQQQQQHQCLQPLEVQVEVQQPQEQQQQQQQQRPDQLSPPPSSSASSSSSHRPSYLNLEYSNGQRHQQQQPECRYVHREMALSYVDGMC